MSKSATHPLSVQIIKATTKDLETYAKGFHDKTIQAKDFCEYLKQAHGSRAQEVIVDISGEVFSDLNLADIDFGNIIASKRKVGREKTERGTQFQNCTLRNTKLCSKSSMAGLEFNRCRALDGMMLEGDIADVKFDVGTNITGINLTRAHNIDKCIIDPQCIVSNVKLGFPDEETFTSFMSYKNDIERIDNRPIEQINPNSIPPAPIVERAEQQVLNPGMEISVSAMGSGVWRVTRSGVAQVASAVTTVASNARDFVTGKVIIGADKSPEPAELHSYSIKAIISKNPIFASKEIGYEITRAEVEEWIRNNTIEGEGFFTDPMSLEEYIRTNSDDDIKDQKLYMNNLSLKGIAFPELTFGDINISKCDFSHATFNSTNLNNVVARDCNFSNASFSKVQAQEADFTRSLFSGAAIINTNFSKSTFVEASFSPLPNTSPTQIITSTLDYTDMRDAIMYDTEITSTTFNGADLSNFIGEGAKLLDVEFINSNLSDASFAEAQITNMTVENAKAYNFNLEKSKLSNVHFKNVTAQGINLRDAKANNVNIVKSDISYGDATGATLASVTIKESQAIKLQARSFNTVALNQKEADALNPQKVGDQAVQTTINIDDLKSYKGLSIVDSDFRGSDFSGSLFTKSELSNVDLSHATMRNIVVRSSLITGSNLHGADLSGGNEDKTEYHDSTITGSDLTDANFKDSKIRGGAFTDNDISGADISHSEIGSHDAKVKFEGVKGGISTNLAHTTSDTTSPDASVKVSNFHGGSDAITLGKLSQISEKNIELSRSTIHNMTNSVGSEGSSWLSGISNFITSIAQNLKQHKKSRLGMVVGIATGVAIGGLVIGYLASTMGLGLIPLAIAGAIAVTAGAVGGGVIGNNIQNTNTGRGVLAMMSGAIGAMVMGPVGIAVAPAVMAYNIITGEKSPIKSAAGSMLDTFIAKPMAAIAGFVAGVVPNVLEAKAAQRFNQEGERRQEVVKQERNALNSIKPQDIHSQSVDTTLLTLQNQCQAPIKLVEKPRTWKDRMTNAKKTITSKFTDLVSRKPSSSAGNIRRIS